MKIYDKAIWQIEGGIDNETVIKHFNTLFYWLKEHNMLNKNGQEILELGIDASVSLNDSLLTEEGAGFLENCYDSLIESSKYGSDDENTLLSDKYEEFRNKN